MGGAFARVPEHADPIPESQRGLLGQLLRSLGRARGRRGWPGWARDAHAALLPYAAAGEYVNFLGSAAGDADPRAAALAAYGEAKLARLRELKRRWDPANVFSLNHNIDPAGRPHRPPLSHRPLAAGALPGSVTISRMASGWRRRLWQKGGSPVTH